MNPFNPSFGNRPERFIGRDMIISEVLNALENLNSPWRSTLITGIRGSGKTALLSDIQKRLEGRDVVVVSLTPNEDFLFELLSLMYEQIPARIKKKMPKIKSIDTKLGIAFEFDEQEAPYFTNNFRYQITMLLKELKKNKLKTIFMIDETQKDEEGLRIFISTYQHLIREEYEVNLIMAGLPYVISSILKDKILTFLRRAKRVELQNVDLALVHLSYSEVFTNMYTDSLIETATNETKGYPYLFQLLGYYLWESYEKGKNEESVLEAAIIKSKVDLFENVHELVFDELSQKDKEFLMKMNLTGGGTKTADMMKRLEKDKGYVSLYRNRLISQGVIKSLRHGVIGFVLPYTEEFLESKIEELGEAMI